MNKILLAIGKKKREIRAIIVITVLFAYMRYQIVLVKWILGKNISDETAAGVGLYIGFAVGIACLWITHRLTASVYEIAERKFEARCRRLILPTFGLIAYLRLRVDDANSLPFRAIDICKGMLNSQKADADMDLRFHVLVKLARYYAKDEQPREAVKALKSALEIRPYDAIANSRLAERFEMGGKGDEAIRHYQAAQRDQANSNKLKEYFAEQVRRVQTEGSRVSGPFDGSGIGSMPGP